MVTRRKPTARTMTAKETQLVVQLLEGADVVTAAKALGLAERTARAWLTRPVVRDAIHEGRRLVVDAAVTRLAALSSKAHAVIEAVLDLERPGIPWGVRTGAVKMAYELMHQGLGTADLSARLRRFELQAAGKAVHGDTDEGDAHDSGEFAVEAAQ